MLWPDKPLPTRCDILRTTMSVISTVCLMVITVALLSAGVYTVHTVERLQKTYHPEKLGTMFEQASSALSSLHATTTMLQSTHEESSNSLPHMFSDARATMEHAHASLTLSKGLLGQPEIIDMLHNIPVVIQALRDSLPQDEIFYSSVGYALSNITWITHLGNTLSELSSSVNSIDVDHLLSESKAWRNMSLSTVHNIKRILHGI